MEGRERPENREEEEDTSIHSTNTLQPRSEILEVPAWYTQVVASLRKAPAYPTRLTLCMLTAHLSWFTDYFSWLPTIIRRLFCIIASDE